MSELNRTEKQYQEELSVCRKIFVDKNTDYGRSWLMMRPMSLADQIFIKAQRIRSIEEKKESKVGEGIETEWRAIVNYGIMALMQMLHGEKLESLSNEEMLKLYDLEASHTYDLMEAKNHDYGEAWREMRHQTFTDMVLVKLLRNRQIETNDGKTLISEGIDANLRDIVNYAIFALIRFKESHASNN